MSYLEYCEKNYASKALGELLIVGFYTIGQGLISLDIIQGCIE